MRDFLRTLLAGLSLVFMIKPPPAWRVRPAAHFWWLLLPTIGLSVARDRFHVPGEAEFFLDGVQSDAVGALLILGVAVALTAVLNRRVLSWSFAVLATSAALWFSLLTIALTAAQRAWLGTLADASMILFVVLVCWWLLALRRIIDSLFGHRHGVLRGVLALLASVVTVAPALLLDQARYWYPDYSDLAAVYADQRVARRAPGSAETLMADQAARVDAALATLKDGVSGELDAYFLAFGGDADEDVFRNEVEYASTLFEQRFGLAGRTLTLLNHPQTTERYPLASLTNLRRSLRGIAQRMNGGEDLLILFMTTHGSREHELRVHIDPLPLDDITPESLRGALDEAGIDWRVVIVSACFSGGYVAPLASPTSLILTAASAERSSFGCGTESQITFFGQALLVDALNQTTSLTDAFERARVAVAAREKALDFEASEPQMSAGALIGGRLASWELGLPQRPAVAFAPAAVCAETAACAPP